MASREHSCTRRALLAGAAGTVALPAPSHRPAADGDAAGPQGERGAWAAALAALERAEAEIAAFKRAEPADAGFEAQWALDEAFGDLVCLQNRALGRLLLVPAPDGAALAVKLARAPGSRSEEHTSELQSQSHLVC